MLLIKQGGSKEFETTTAEDLALMFNVPLEKIRKSPEFIINPKRINSKKSGQSKEISIPAGTAVAANMFVKLKGKTLEIRYAQTINQVEKGDKIVDEYHPRKIKFLGENQLIEDQDMDLAVYMMLYPLCKQSPFRDQVKEQYHWAFKDIEAEDTEAMEETVELMNALQSIYDYKGEPLRIVAKAFGLTGTDTLEDVSVQALLVKIAKDPMVPNAAKEFNKVIGSQTHIFKGLTMNAIDRGLFVLKTVGLTEFWMWGEGEKKGNRIVDVVNNGNPKSETLLIHIQDNIQEFYPILMNAQKSMSSKNVAKSFLDNQPKIDLNKMFSDFGGGSDEVSNGDDFQDDDDHEQELIKAQNLGHSQAPLPASSANNEANDTKSSLDVKEEETKATEGVQVTSAKAPPEWLQKATADIQANKQPKGPGRKPGK